MSISLQFKLTKVGQAACWNAKNTGLDVAITHVQFGSGNKAPTGTELALLQPKQAVAIAGGFAVSESQIRMSAIFGGAQSYAIREVGLWDDDPAIAGSRLIAYWSQPAGDLAYKSPDVDFIFSHDMALDAAVPAGTLTIYADAAQSAMLAMISAHETNDNPHPVSMPKPRYVTFSGTYDASPSVCGSILAPYSAGPHTLNLPAPFDCYGKKISVYAGQGSFELFIKSPNHVAIPVLGGPAAKFYVDGPAGSSAADQLILMKGDHVELISDGTSWHCYYRGPKYSLGYKQAWKELSGSRAAETYYYNFSGSPMLVSISFRRDNSTNITGLYVNGTMRSATSAQGVGTHTYTLTAVVPSAGSYILSGGSPTVHLWNELGE